MLWKERGASLFTHFRPSQEQNREEALQRLQELLLSVASLPRKRKPTKPTRNSQRKRLDRKTKHSALKSSRKTIFLVSAGNR
jgi:ribosome-associated protein